jgi:transposase
MILINPDIPVILQCDKFTRYTDHGHMDIDNIIIENTIKSLALGRKNFLFAGHHDATIYNGYYFDILGTCKPLGVNPYDFLIWYPTKVPSLNTSD